MACPETGAKSVVSYAVQTNADTPATTGFQEIPVTNFGLSLTKEVLESAAITNTKEVERHGNRQVSGDITVELAAGLYDDLLESAMFGEWDNSFAGPDQLIVGTTAKYFTFQDAATSINQNRLYTGCTVGSMSVSVAPNAMVSPTFNLLGRDSSISTTRISGTSYGDLVPFDAYSGSLLIGDAGAIGSAGQVTQIDFTVEHGLEQAFVVGSETSVCTPKGQTMVSGSFTLHYTDDDAITRFVEEVESALNVTVNDPSGVNEYGFIFPRIKINSAGTPYGGQGARFVEVVFSALRDTVYNSPLVITRPDTT